MKNTRRRLEYKTLTAVEINQLISKALYDLKFISIKHNETLVFKYIDKQFGHCLTRSGRKVLEHSKKAYQSQAEQYLSLGNGNYSFQETEKFSIKLLVKSVVDKIIK